MRIEQIIFNPPFSSFFSPPRFDESELFPLPPSLKYKHKQETPIPEENANFRRPNFKSFIAQLYANPNSKIPIY
jgi:hypothetical protein